MYRTAFEDLWNWKKNDSDRPMMIAGIPHIGKTWLMQEFGRIAFAETIYLNCILQPELLSHFRTASQPSYLLSMLELQTGHRIPNTDTLLILDDIPEDSRILSCLFSFQQNPHLSVLCACDADHPALSTISPSPDAPAVLRLYPMTFSEFTAAMGEWNPTLPIMQTAAGHQLYLDLLRSYCFVGGMPEMVSCFQQIHHFDEVRQLQEQMLEQEEELICHRLRAYIGQPLDRIWHSVPEQLSLPQKKFVYHRLRQGGRARDYEAAIDFLAAHQFLYRLYHRDPAAPLSMEASDAKSFKLYYPDVGLLACALGFPPQELLEQDAIFTAFHGALTEQYVCQQLMPLSQITASYYTNERASCEVNFLLQRKGDPSILPLDARAIVSPKAKNLQVYQDRFHPERTIRASLSPYRQEAHMLHLPLYAVEDYVKQLLQIT